MTQSDAAAFRLKNWQSPRLNREEPLAKKAGVVDVFRDARQVIEDLAKGAFIPTDEHTFALTTPPLTPHCRTKADLTRMAQAVADALKAYALDHDFNVAIQITRAPKEVAQQHWQPIESFVLQVIMKDEAQLIATRQRIAENKDALLEGLKETCRIPDELSGGRVH